MRECPSPSPRYRRSELACELRSTCPASLSRRTPPPPGSTHQRSGTEPPGSSPGPVSRGSTRGLPLALPPRPLWFSLPCLAAASSGLELGNDELQSAAPLNTLGKFPWLPEWRHVQGSSEHQCIDPSISHYLPQTFCGDPSPGNRELRCGWLSHEGPWRPHAHSAHPLQEQIRKTP